MSTAGTVKRWMQTAIRFRAAGEAVAAAEEGEAEGTKLLSPNRTGLLLLLLVLPRGEAEEVGDGAMLLPAIPRGPRVQLQQTRLD